MHTDAALPNADLENTTRQPWKVRFADAVLSVFKETKTRHLLKDATDKLNEELEISSLLKRN